MSKFVITLIASVILLQPLWSGASGNPSDSHAKPMSFSPHASANGHVYGAPIGPAIMGHAKTAHDKHPAKKKSAKPKK